MPDLIETVRQRLLDQGGRMTPQRRLVLQALEELCDHPTAEDLYDIVQQWDPRVHLSTIYRTLRWLESEGLVKTRLFEGDHRKERFDPTRRPEHDHFMCTTCNRLIEFDDDLVNTIKARFEHRTGATVQSGSVTLYGICAQCR